MISHPHFYTTHLTWASVFDCPVYVHSADKEWLNREDKSGHREFINAQTQEIVPGVTAIRCGGHFPGSLVLHWEKHLFIADTMVNVPVKFTQYQTNAYNTTLTITRPPSLLPNLSPG